MSKHTESWSVQGTTSWLKYILVTFSWAQVYRNRACFYPFWKIVFISIGANPWWNLTRQWMIEPVLAGKAHRSLSGLVIGRAQTCKIAKTVAVFWQACWPRKTCMMKNLLCPCKSSLSFVFCAHSFCFKLLNWTDLANFNFDLSSV